MIADPWIGRTLGAYQIIDLLGRGGMGAVYRALHPVLERYAAIKFLRADRADDSERDERFLREARAIAHLRHPHIVQLYDFGTYEDGYYMILELVPGESLHDHLRRLQTTGKRLEKERTWRIMEQVMDALSYVHRQGLVHRDIKPSNILLNLEGDAILADFGIVRRMADEVHTATGAFIGTPAYMAPEQAQGLPADHRADLYALAVVLYELLTGRPPFVAESSIALVLKHLQELPPPLHQFAPDTPPALEQAIAKALAKSPEDRFQNVAAFRSALAHIFGPPAETDRPTSVVPAQLPSASAPETPPTGNLPFLRASLVGRRSEINTVKQLIGRPPAFVALVGLGGLGKTTVALAVAHELAAEAAFTDGVFWLDGRAYVTLGDIMVELASLLKLDLGQQTLSQQRRALTFHLTGRKALVVLDNLETVEEEAAVAAFLAELPCAVLVTSRTHPAGSQIIELPPLPREAAVSLFQLAAGLRPEEVDEAAVDLCAHDLDGHPLAIEVVGALVAAGLDPNEVRRYLRETPLDVLSEKATSAGRSLIEALQLSYQRLSALAQLLLARTSLFAADFDLNALAALSPEHSRLHQVKGLRELTERSLLVQVSRQRYRLHPVTRQFAYSLLPDAAPFHRRIGAYFLTEAGRDTLAAAEQFFKAQDMTEAAELIPPHMDEWLEGGQGSRALRLISEFNLAALPADLRLGLNEAQGDALALLGQSAESLGAYQRALTAAPTGDTQARLKRKIGQLIRRQQPAEAVRWFEEALAHLTDQNSLEAARIFVRMGAAYRRKGDYEQAARWCEKGQALAAQSEAATEIAEANINLGAIYDVRGEAVQALAAYAQALQLLQQEPRRRPALEALILSNQAALYFDQGDWGTAQALHEQTLQIAETLGDVDTLARTCFNLGHLASLTGDFATAEANLNRCLALWQHEGSDYGLAATQMNVGLLRLRQGQLTEAEAALHNSLEMFQAIDSQDFLPEVYRLLSELALARQQVGAALAYAQQALQLAQQMETPMEEGAARRGLGLALIADGQLEPALHELEASRAVLTTRGNRYELARTQLAFGQGPGDPTLARAYLRQALETFTQLGAQPEANVARQELDRLDSANALASTID